MKKQFSLMSEAKYFVVASVIVILAGVVMLFTNGFVLGIDFSGGSILTLDMGQTFENADAPVLQQYVDGFWAANGLSGDKTVSAAQGNQAVIRYQAYSDDSAKERELRANLETDLKKTYPNVKEVSRDQVGATAGREMRLNALYSVALACLLMLIYIWRRFELAFGIAAIISLIHDVVIMAAVMIFTRTQINSSFIAAMLTIVGYSINDTIVLFDRIRENVKKMKGETREKIVDTSFQETLTRTLNTSLTVFITLVALYVLGVQSIKEFALPLIAGVVSGTYSSILIAAPLWIWIHWAADKRRKQNGKGGKAPVKGGNKQLAKSKV
jgi:preprotein translocase subunit SecF